MSLTPDEAWAEVDKLLRAESTLHLSLQTQRHDADIRNRLRAELARPLGELRALYGHLMEQTTQPLGLRGADGHLIAAGDTVECARTMSWEGDDGTEYGTTAGELRVVKEITQTGLVFENGDSWRPDFWQFVSAPAPALKSGPSPYHDLPARQSELLREALERHDVPKPTVSQLNNDDHDEVRALHRVVRAMHDGECPACHTLHAPGMMLAAGRHRYRCPFCDFSISAAEAGAVIEEFSVIVSKDLAIFETWREKLRDSQSPVTRDKAGYSLSREDHVVCCEDIAGCPVGHAAVVEEVDAADSVVRVSGYLDRWFPATSFYRVPKNP